MCAPKVFVFVNKIELLNDLSTWLSAATFMAKSKFLIKFLYFLSLTKSQLINLTLFLSFRIFDKKLLLAAYVNLSKIKRLDLGMLSYSFSHIWDPIKPAPPVINIFINIFNNIFR